MGVHPCTLNRNSPAGSDPELTNRSADYDGAYQHTQMHGLTFTGKFAAVLGPQVVGRSLDLFQEDAVLLGDNDTGNCANSKERGGSKQQVQGAKVGMRWTDEAAKASLTTATRW